MSLVASANLCAWYRDLFVWPVALPLVVGIGLGLVWLLMLLGQQMSTVRMEGRAAGSLNAIIASVVFFGICAVLYAMALGTQVSVDLTQEGRRELEPQTVQVLKTLNKEVEITCFFLDSDDDLLVIAREKTLRFLDLCKQFTPLLKVVEEDPQLAPQKWEEMGITRASAQGTVVIQAAGRKRVLTLSGASPRLEERDFTNALISVLRDAEPKVAFLTGHGERRIEEAGGAGASLLADLLQRESYKVESIAIKITEPMVPADADVLVINNPNNDLLPQEIHAIDEFIDRGGRVLLLVDPWARVNSPNNTGEQLRPWLSKRFGIEVGSDVVVSEERQEALQVELNADSAPFAAQDRDTGFTGSLNASHPITRGFDQAMLLQLCRTVAPVAKAPEKVAVAALLRTGPQFWAETDIVGLRETRKAQRAEDETRGPLMLACAATYETDVPIEGANRNKEGRIVVVGDSNLSANDGIQVPGNLNFIMNTFAWLTESEQLIAVRPRGKNDPPLVLSPANERAIFWFSTLFTAQIALAAGVIMAVKRRRNQ